MQRGKHPGATQHPPVAPGARWAKISADNVMHGWHRLIPRIAQPTLVCAGAASLHPLSSQAWIAETLPRGTLDVCPAQDGGSHFPMFETPARFNAQALAFLGQ